MAVLCKCSTLEVKPACIMYSIQKWKANVPLICIVYFDHIHIESGTHDCIHISVESLEQDVVETLTYAPICNEIYDKFIETHPDNKYILQNILKTYKDIITSKEYVDKLYVILWTKDFLHGSFGCL